MKAWLAALAALLFLNSPVCSAADDLPGAARELARKTSGWVRGRVAATYRNLSSLPDSELARVRQEFEAALSGPPEAAPAAEARLTLSENASQFLLVEEARRGDDSQVWITAWRRADRPAASGFGMALDKKLVWEQDDPILDVAVMSDGVVVLSPSGLTVHLSRGGTQQTAAISSAKPWPRDLRGRLRVTGGHVQVFLPGMTCNGALEPALTLECRASDEPWVLESGSRGILLANFAAGRNYFDGRVVLQNGARKSVAPFYTAAAAEDQGNTFWLLALVGGRAQIFDGALEPAGMIPGWGSDLVGINARCGEGSQVLATRPGDANEPDAIQAFSIRNRAAASLAPPVTFAGPITALWPSGPASALAVARDTATGKYAAYVLTMACTP